MMDPSKGTTGNVVYTVSEVHKDDEHFGKHVELGQSWDRINDFFESLKNTLEYYVSKAAELYMMDPSKGTTAILSSS